MIVDSGYAYTYFVPVHEGYVLDKAMSKYQVGGKVISEVIELYLKNERGVLINPEYEIWKFFPKQKVIWTETTAGSLMK